MAFGGFSKSGDSAPMVEPNMIPLIDVMLVLLVIFIITAPLLTHAVKIDLPKAASHANLTKPDHIALSINGAGEMFWNGEQVDNSTLRQRLAAAAKINPQPELHLRVHRTTEYHKVAEVMSGAARAGLVKIGFVTEPGEAH